MFVSPSKLFILYNAPRPPFHQRPSTLLGLPHRDSITSPLLTLSAVPHNLLLPSRSNPAFPIKSSEQVHSQPINNTLQENNHVPDNAYLVPPSHPWPEWSELLESISIAGDFDVDRNIKDEFVPNESLSMEFLDAACSCLHFAQYRPDVLGWLPKHDIQVLIEDGAPFIFKNALETERRMRSFLQGEEPNEATTVDLMKYILSYASNPIIYPERNIREATESSARNLLREMANFNGKGATLSMAAMENYSGAGEDEQTPINRGSNITMKRGDWICPKCSFMNIAKNMKCLECEELRPQRQLTGCEWDCPQCNFYNYGRNTVCLKCECRRPGEGPMPIGQVKTPPDRQLINSQYPNKSDDKRTPNGSDDLRTSNKNPETALNGSLDQFLSNAYTKSNSRGQDARKDGRFLVPKGSNSGYAPFVPLPADMFAKKSKNTTIDDREEAVTKNSDLKATVSISNSQKTATKVENQIKDAAEEEKSERWFEKVAELHDVTDLASAMSDDDFPEIMPMRKGENRFVVSKKKDRSLTSPTYKRQEAMEQGSNSNFVPFVPFPPDYFAKKDDKQQSESTTPTVKPTDKTPSHMPLENLSKAINDTNLVQETRNQRMNDSNTMMNSSSTQINRSSTGPETSYSDQVTPENQNVRNRWEGKSLEGSAVKETDPLDMSEEAKAERWFRRVAQIKDMSELSQIPDEDFPSIMPMRKGVNRFVVSKRKTPLERRLASPQYRKDLRSVNSDPTNKEGE